MTIKKSRLGRGLDVLLSDNTVTSLSLSSTLNARLEEIAIKNIKTGDAQPRHDFTEETLNELADSIRAQGIIQPIIVRAHPAGHYEIVAGERRWRAAKLAGFEKIPALVRELHDETAVAMALVENIQREDLNPIEEAKALQRLTEQFGLTQQEIAEAVGRSRSDVANRLRLLALHPDVSQLLRERKIDMGHARALLALDHDLQPQTAHTITSKQFSVRQAEALVQRLLASENTPKTPAEIRPELAEMQSQLTQKLGARVAIKSRGKQGGGAITITYKNKLELARLLGLIL